MLDGRSSLRAALEAMLFAAPEPLAPGEAARILGVSEEEIRALAAELAAAYDADPERGFQLEEVAGGYQLVTKPAYAAYVSQIGRPVHRGGLSQAALEVLAIIAYRQPISRAEIEAIRGVRSDSALASLLERGLIEEVGRGNGPGRPVLYGTTSEFLVQMGLRSLEDLPPLPDATDSRASP